MLRKRANAARLQSKTHLIGQAARSQHDRPQGADRPRLARAPGVERLVGPERVGRLLQELPTRGTTWS